MEPLNRPLKDISLLLVEDEVEARDMLERMLGLNYQGVKIYTADNGVSGLEVFRRLRPEIVVTDINMPQMNGIAMARGIKELEPEATIVAVTAHSETSYLLSAIEIGMDHYVLKPVNYPELFHVLDRIAEKIMLKRLVSEQVERIRRREQQLSQAERITHLGSWEWNLESGETVWSDELYRILGLEPESVAATFESLLRMVHPADRETMEKAVQQLRETGSALGIQYYRLLRADGETRIVRGQLESVRDGSGRQTVIGACHDVTELKWAEAALRASERRFSKIFQATPDLLSITSLKDGTILEVNEAFLRVLGYQRQEVIGTYAGELGLWADSDQPAALLQQLEERGEVRDIEVRLKGRNGRELEGLVSAELIEINGNPYLLTLFKDISERKRLEEDRARLAAIVESSDDAIMAVDREGAITSWNAGAEKMFGYCAQDMKGVHLSFLVSPEKKEQVTCLNDGIRSDGAVTHCEVVHVTRGGSQIYVSLTMSPIKSADGGIVGTSCIARDVTERTRMEEIIKHQAQHDTLTDLPNRKLFGDFLNLELAQARRNRKSLAVLFMDLDHFKKVNDSLGHAAGDRLLQAVAQRLKRCVRESDTVARISGDEFNVLMPDLTQTDDVGIVVGKIMGVFRTPFVLEGAELKVTTSVGVSMFPDDGDSAQELLQKADGAMYVAKQTPGNSYQFYNGEINARTVARQNMERRLREAVSKDELDLVYQPLLSLESGEIVGAEALLRWHHPEHGLLLPAQFLPVAEETGAIVPIGEWVLFNACRQMRLWQSQGFDLSVAVNLSNREFHQPNFIDLAMRALSQSGLDPASLELDVTEKAIMDNPAFSLRNMRRLTDIGVAFSVDDFGVGASSLSRIKELPIAKVKIDRSFIRDILTEPNDLDVVSAVICMSHSLKMRVNAVGVESAEQLALVGSFGCDEVQGDLISRPLPPHEFERLLVEGGVHAEF
uniref:Response regulator receiver modulated diguanylate cyclase/phosphodiesterase with PAS/PAC sensor(S) n=1 Tax=Geobacter sp. (strain M21) TaxID=443144 RepID=C6E953_GEOSM